MSEKKWYENADFVDKLKIEFEKAGLPLEYKAKKIFEEKGFYANSSYYKVPIDNVLDSSIVEKDGTWRQIDIEAHTEDHNLDIKLQFNKFNLDLTTIFIGECKFSSNKSFFLFKSNSDYLVEFPLSIWGNNLLEYNSMNYMSSHEKYFDFNVYENIVEVNTSKLTNKNDNYNDRISHQACEQLFYAVNYQISSLKYGMKYDIRPDIIQSQLFKKWMTFLSENNIQIGDAIDERNKIDDSIALKFLEENFELSDLDEITSYMILPVFPILIINENAGLFEVEFDEKNDITGFNKIKFGIYTNYAFEKSKKPYVIYRPDDLGIIICDISHLAEAIDTVLKGFNKLCNELKQTLDEKPYLLGYELLFNPDLIDPNEYFEHSTPRRVYS